MPESIGRLLAAEKNILKRSAAALVGIAQGMLCDGELSDSEIAFLTTWLEHNTEISSVWPGNAVYARVRDTLADGGITEEERDYIVVILQQLIGEDDIPDAQGHVTQLAFDRTAQVKIPGNLFCLTGDFIYGTKSFCEKAILQRGGFINKTITQKINYLVVGGNGSPEWKHGSYGTKIEKAMEYKANAVPITIVHETQWVKALTS